MTTQLSQSDSDFEQALLKGRQNPLSLRKGLVLKLLHTIPDGHLVRFTKNILSNSSFKLKTSALQISRIRILNYGLPQDSILSSILFNIYISDIPTTVSHQFDYADDMALLSSHECWPKVE